MKINITISLDEQIVYALKKQNNYSNLANKVLKDYFEAVEVMDLPKLMEKQAKIKGILKKSRAEEKILKLRIKKIKEKESKVLKICRGMKKEDFEMLQNCKTTFALASLHRGALKKYKWVDIKKIFTELKGGIPTK